MNRTYILGDLPDNWFSDQPDYIKNFEVQRYDISHCRECKKDKLVILYDNKKEGKDHKSIGRYEDIEAYELILHKKIKYDVLETHLCKYCMIKILKEYRRVIYDQFSSMIDELEIDDTK